MKQITKANVCLFFALLMIPFSIHCFEGNNLLSSEDLELQSTDLKKPVLSISFDGSDRRETYNQWACFDTEQVRFESSEVNYAGKLKWLPVIMVTTLGQRFEFSLYEEFGEDGQEVLKQWQELSSGAPEICFYAPFLQYIHDADAGLLHSQWILSRIKTKTGQWIVNHKLDENFESLAESRTPRSN